MAGTDILETIGPRWQLHMSWAGIEPGAQKTAPVAITKRIAIWGPVIVNVLFFHSNRATDLGESGDSQIAVPAN